MEETTFSFIRQWLLVTKCIQWTLVPTFFYINIIQEYKKKNRSLVKREIIGRCVINNLQEKRNISSFLINGRQIYPLSNFVSVKFFFVLFFMNRYSSDYIAPNFEYLLAWINECNHYSFSFLNNNNAHSFGTLRTIRDTNFRADEVVQGTVYVAWFHFQSEIWYNNLQQKDIARG